MTESTERLDLAAIKAEHQPGDTYEFCLACIGGVDDEPGVSRVVEHDGANLRLDYVLPARWPCLPYLLADRITAVLALHHRISPEEDGDYCLECDDFYPCPTARALGLTE